MESKQYDSTVPKSSVVSGQKRCITCKHFDPRNGFCRKNPPVPVYVYDKIKSCYPVITYPDTDYCDFYETLKSTELING